MFAFVPIWSALPLKADVAAVGRESPLLTQSGHPSWSRYMHSVGAETQVSPAGAAVYRLGLLLFVAITLRSRGRPIGSIRAAGPSGLVGALISSCLFGSHTEYKSEYALSASGYGAPRGIVVDRGPHRGPTFVLDLVQNNQSLSLLPLTAVSVQTVTSHTNF
jgi:hypothetical protein